MTKNSRDIQISGDSKIASIVGGEATIYTANIEQNNSSPGQRQTLEEAAK
ncbi:MAG: hypothetical protein F6K24_45250, partial [Okeania sp. SIO2D1]|nr:hypothetical protein [Okeania sp. SIO2D1]